MKKEFVFMFKKVLMTEKGRNEWKKQTPIFFKKTGKSERLHSTEKCIVSKKIMKVHIFLYFAQKEIAPMTETLSGYKNYSQLTFENRVKIEILV